MTDNVVMTDANHSSTEISKSTTSLNRDDNDAYVPGKFTLKISIFVLITTSILTPISGIAYLFSIWILFGGYDVTSVIIRIGLVVVYVVLAITTVLTLLRGFLKILRTNIRNTTESRYGLSIVFSTLTLFWLFTIFLMFGGGVWIAGFFS